MSYATVTKTNIGTYLFRLWETHTLIDSWEKKETDTIEFDAAGGQKLIRFQALGQQPVTWAVDEIFQHNEDTLTKVWMSGNSGVADSSPDGAK